MICQQTLGIRLQFINTPGKGFDWVVATVKTPSQSGLQTGDALISVDGVEIASDMPSIAQKLNDLEPGSKVNVQVRRDGQTISLDAVRQETTSVGSGMDSPNGAIDHPGPMAGGH